MSEAHLILHCAPTLAGLKTGSLFNCTHQSEKALRETLRKLNRRLSCRGLRILPLRITENRALIYLYRPSGLRRDLEDRSAARLLSEQGYSFGSCENCILQLIRRMESCDEFPHEIGLFLGYPPEDVKGFMENNACNSKCTGCWKVYGDEQAAKKRFDQYKKCSRIYRQCWENGATLERLAVAR